MDETLFIGLEKNRIFFNAANIIISKNKDANIVKRFSTDKGVIDFIIKEKSGDKLIFLLLIENKAKDFSIQEDWNKIIKCRHLEYGIKWYLQKYEKDNPNIKVQIDLMEMFQKNKKIVAKQYKNVYIPEIQLLHKQNNI